MSDELRAGFEKWVSQNTNWNPVWNGEQYQERDHELAWLGFQARVPAGYCVVPIEPTTEMKIAGDHAGFWCGDKYRAMLSAAPRITP